MKTIDLRKLFRQKRGNFGHKGRPGHVGGSAPSGSGDPWLKKRQDSFNKKAEERDMTKKGIVAGYNKTPKGLDKYIADRLKIANTPINKLRIGPNDRQYEPEWIIQRAGFEAQISKELGHAVEVGDDMSVFDHKTGNEIGWLETDQDGSNPTFQGSEEWLSEHYPLKSKK